MKNKLVLVLVFLGFTSFSCYAQSSSNDQRIVGTWTFTSRFESDASTTFVFNANGSGTIRSTGGGETFEGTFTYGISLGGRIYFLLDYNTNGNVFRFLREIGDAFYFSPDGRTLILETPETGGMVFRKR